MRHVLSVIVAICVSCGGVGVDAPTWYTPKPDMASPVDAGPMEPHESVVWRGGSRLKRRLIVGFDGSSQYDDSFWDTTLQLACKFYEVDGASRCLPTRPVTPTYYEDAGCSQPVFAFPSCDVYVGYITFLVPTFGQPNRPAACRGEIHAAKLKDVSKDVEGYSLYLWDGYQCRSVGVAFNPYQRLAVVEREIAQSEFAIGAPPVPVDD